MCLLSSAAVDYVSISIVESFCPHTTAVTGVHGILVGMKNAV